MRDLEEDMRNDAEVLTKIKTREDYAQNVYAAMCNMRWCPRDMIPALRQDEKVDLWSASWRSAGGIVADLRDCGEDYMDWYCSGMGGLATYNETEGEEYMARQKYVPESTITDEVLTDFNRLGWFPVPWEDD